MGASSICQLHKWLVKDPQIQILLGTRRHTMNIDAMDSEGDNKVCQLLKLFFLKFCIIWIDDFYILFSNSCDEYFSFCRM